MQKRIRFFIIYVSFAMLNLIFLGLTDLETISVANFSLLLTILFINLDESL